MRPRLLLFVLFAVLVGTSTAGATGTLDQSQTLVTNAKGLREGFFWAQTFTAGITGDLDQVNVFLGRVEIGPATGNIVVQIRSVDGNVPSDTVLGSGVIAEANVPLLLSATWVAAPLTSAAVVAGTKYAVVLMANGLSDYDVSSAGDVYSGGEEYYQQPDAFGSHWFSEGTDMTFQTFVTPSGTNHRGGHRHGH
jgi:hypothetical protein